MPPKRTYGGRRTALTRSKAVVRKTRTYPTTIRNRISRPFSSGFKWEPTKIFKLKQILDTNFSSSTVAIQSTAYIYGLSTFDQVATLGALFDQYRIVKVLNKLTPRVTETNTIGTSIGCNLYTVIDYDDATLLGSVAAAREYTTCKESGPHEIVYRNFKPRIAMAAYSGAFSSFANMEDEWIDIASTTVQYYGLKTVTSTANANQTWDLRVEVHAEFRNVR